MREIPDGIALQSPDNVELHFIDDDREVIVELWDVTGSPSEVRSFRLPYSEIVEFVRYSVPPKMHDILRQHGVELALVK